MSVFLERTLYVFCCFMDYLGEKTDKKQLLLVNFIVTSIGTRFKIKHQAPTFNCNNS